MENAKIALKFAKSMGFISVEFQEKSNGFDIFIAQPDGNVEIIGYPFFILVKDGIAREYYSSELMQLVHFSEVDKDFTELI